MRLREGSPEPNPGRVPRRPHEPRLKIDRRGPFSCLSSEHMEREASGHDE